MNKGGLQVEFKNMTEKDLPFYLYVHNHKDTIRFLGDPILTEEQALSQFRDIKGGWHIIYNEDKKVGIIKTYARGKYMDIGIDISPEHRRKGLARASYKKLLDQLDKKGIIAMLTTFADNFAVFLYKELGFVEQDNYEKEIKGRRYIKMIRNGK